MEAIKRTDIIRAAEMCVLAYKDPEEIKSQELFDASGKYTIVGSANAFGFVCRYFNRVEIGLRGTDDAMDAYRDADIVQVDHAVYRHTHRGGLLDWAGLSKSILSLISAGDKVRIYGHSLGGLLANYCGIDALSITDDVQIITFGQPMLFGKSGAEKFKDLPILRVRNARDRVPSEPSDSARFLYRWGARKFFKKRVRIPKYYPVGPELWLTEGGRAKPAWHWQVDGHAIADEYLVKCQSHL